MQATTSIELKRDCAAVQIPAGTGVTLPAGTSVSITQTLGGSYTVHAPGGLFRIAPQDADALGLEVAAPDAPTTTHGSVDEKAVWDTLRTCFDPEIPVNIVDLGLVYDMQLAKLPNGNARVDVKMTLTAPGCGMGPVLQQDVSNKLLMIEEVDEANVELVWDPQWNQGMMTEAAKLQLGLL